MLKTDDQHDEINDHGEGLNNDDLDDRGDVDNQEGIYQNVIISIFLLQSWSQLVILTEMQVSRSGVLMSLRGGLIKYFK